MKTPSIVLAIALTTLVSSPAAAVIVPEPEVAVSAAGRNTTSFATAASNDASRAVAVYRQHDGTYERVQARSLGDGTWGPTAVLSSSTGDAESPEVALSASGDSAVAVWVLQDGSDTILQSRWFSNGSWGPLKQIGTDSVAGDPQVDITSDGQTALVIWRNGSGADRVIRAAWGHDGAWDAPGDLTVPGTDSVTPRMDLSDDGSRAIALWRRYTGGFYNVEATEWSGSTWSPPQWLSANAQTSYPTVELVDAGAVAAWVEVRDATLRVVSARRAGGQWEQEDVLSAQGSNSYTPTLDTVGSTAMLAWSRDVSGTRVVEASIDPGNGWGAARTLSRPGESSYDPHVSLSQNGASAMAVWTAANGLDRKVTGSHYANGSWDAPIDVSSVGPLAGTPAVHVNPQAGAGLAFWRGREGNVGQLRTARVRNVEAEVSAPPVTDGRSPAAVSGLKVKVRKGHARVSWRRAEGSDAYRVVLKKRGATKQRIHNVSGLKVRFAVAKGRYRVSVAGVSTSGRGPAAAKRFRVAARR